jgi:hypothetical protein
MKRVPLTRRVPLKSSSKGLKRTRLARVSKKRKSLMAKVKPIRDKYLESKLLCEVCIRRPAIEVHEITRGAAREKSLDKIEVLLAVCRPCHDLLGDNRKWPVTRQLALKFLRAPYLVDLELVNELRGEDQNSIDWDDVVIHLELAK